MPGVDLEKLKVAMMAAGRELAIMSSSADPQLFREEYLRFFAGYQSANGRVQILMMGEEPPVSMSRDEMFSVNAERIAWGKEAGQLSKDSEGVSTVNIDGVPALLMDVVSPQGERLLTYTFFHASYPKHSFAIAIKCPTAEYRNYAQRIETFINTAELDFGPTEENPTLTQPALPAAAKPLMLRQDVKDDGVHGAVTETAGGIPDGERKGTVIEGGYTMSAGGDLVLVGVIGGTLLASMQPVEGWQDLQGSKTDCSILAMEGGKALVEGQLEYRAGRSIFLVPGTTIKNTTTSGEALAITRPNGGRVFGLAHGKTIRITATGGIEQVE